MAYKTYNEELKDRWRGVNLPLWVKLPAKETFEMVYAKFLLDYDAETDIDRKIHMAHIFNKLSNLISAINTYTGIGGIDNGF